MVSTTKRKIKGKEYLYADYSFRLPDGKSKKISKRIEKNEDAKKFKKYFLVKEVESYKKYASSKYKSDLVLTDEKIKKVETFRAEYKQIIKNLTKEQFKEIVDRFTINFTYETNALEGNSLTLKDVTFFIKENILPKGKDLREVYETRNTRKAVELLFDNKIKINIKSILKLHRIIVKDTGVNIGFKKIPNFLLMRNVKTTPPEKVEKEMRDLIKWYENAKEHPIKIASIFHGRFEKIHPFDDGNGRVGRILINAILLDRGFPPLIIRKTMKMSYFSALEAFDNGYNEKLERFILKKLEKTFNSFFKVYVDYL